MRETSRAKNAALKETGAVVPDSFDDLGISIEGVFKVNKLQVVQSKKMTNIKQEMVS